MRVWRLSKPPPSITSPTNPPTRRSLQYFQNQCQKARPKKTILLRMIRWEDGFNELSARVLFGRNELTLSWALGEPMPAGLVDDIMKALDTSASPSDSGCLAQHSEPAPPFCAVMSSIPLRAMPCQLPSDPRQPARAAPAAPPDQRRLPSSRACSGDAQACKQPVQHSD